MTPTLLLLHGAWAGPAIWDDLRTELDARALPTVAPDLLDQGGPPEAATFDGALARLVARVDAIEAPVIVVGHSGGGVLTTALAEARPDRIAWAVYVAGHLLPPGQSYGRFIGEWLAQPDQARRNLPGITGHLVHDTAKGTTAVPEALARQFFFHDVPEAAWDRIRPALRPFPQAVREAGADWTPEGFGRVRKAYVECGDDRSILPEVQRQFRARTPVDHVTTLPCGHAPMLVCPGDLADILAGLAQG